jgi:hypothetical protein
MEAMSRSVASPRAKSKLGFADDILAAFRKGKSLRIRAGTVPHRFIGIWFVVVNNRVFVRSWSIKPRGWYRTFLDDSCGTIQIAGREIAVRAMRTRDRRVRDAVDRAYLDKYSTPATIKYAGDLGSAASRATTLELRPIAPARIASK